MTGVTGFPGVANSDPMKGPQQMTAIGQHFDDLAAETVTTASNLPSQGNWKKRLIMAEDTGMLYICTALPGTWRRITSGLMCRYQLNAQQTGIAGQLTLIWSTSATIDNASFQTTSSTFTIPATGIYRLSVGIFTSGVIGRQMLYSVNGGTAIRITAASGATGSAPSSAFGSMIQQFNAGDVIRFIVQDVSAGLAVLPDSWCAIELIN